MGKYVQMISFQQNPTLQHSLSEYVTDLQWSAQGKVLVAATAAGQVSFVTDRQLNCLRSADGKALDSLAFSADGDWLAAVGQEGQVLVWNWAERTLKTTLDQGNEWIDRLCWQPQSSQFAFSLGKYVQIWQPEQENMLHTINFENSVVWALAWHPSGDWLTVGGYQGIKLWSRQDWFADPIGYCLPTATQLMAWSQTGRFLVINTIDGLAIILEWQAQAQNFIEKPWHLQGFPGKVRGFAWWGDNLLATCSGSEIVTWLHDANHNANIDDWAPQVLDGHTDRVTSISFHPQQCLLASGSEDGMVMLWPNCQKNSVKRSQTLTTGAAVTKLAWQPQGEMLAAGTADGQVLIWKKSSSGKGFGS